MPLRVVYANDYGSINHCGSKLLNRELKRAIGRIATLAASIRHDALDTPGARRAIARGDVLVINGEGNFRGGNPRKLHQILDLARIGREQGRRVALVNTVAADLPGGLPLERFDHVSVRESASAQALRTAGYAGALDVVPDATLLVDWRWSGPRRERVVVTDCVWDAPTRALRALQAELRRRGVDAVFAPFQRGLLPRVSARRMLRRFARARLVVSGRFHGNCFALITGTPVVSIDSNSHKTRGFMEDLGLGALHFESVEHLRGFLLESGAGGGRIPEVPVTRLSAREARDAVERSLRAAIGPVEGTRA